MKKILFIVLVACSCFGCAKGKQVMVHPSTWEQANCSAWGVGVIGAPMALAQTYDCVNIYKVKGFVTLEEMEAKEPPRFMIDLDSKDKVAEKPTWKAGDFWEYKSSNGNIGKLTIDTRGSFDETEGYYALSGKEKRFYSLGLGLRKTFGVVGVDTDYIPALRPFDFPLAVDQSWSAYGVMKRNMSKMNIATHYEVLGYGKIKVPAGEFLAYYIISKDDYGLRVAEMWYSPEVKYLVKTNYYTSKGRFTEELIRYKLN